MTRTQVLAVVAFVTFVGVGGNIWLLVQEARGHIRTRGWNTKLLRGLSVLSGAVIIGTAIFARPWYWDLTLTAMAVVGVRAVFHLLRALWRGATLSLLRALGLASSAMVAGVGLLGLAGVAAVLDVATLSSPSPILGYHGGGLLRVPTLYQVFWGPEWEGRGLPSVTQAVGLEHALPGSAWAKAVASAGLGVSEFTDGGCWIDPTPPAPDMRIPGTGAPAFQGELAAAFSGRHRLRSCPGPGSGRAPRTLPADAVVALWLPGSVPFDIGGVAEHGSIMWPGHRRGLVVAGLPGGYASWGLSSCRRSPACAGLPTYADPSYALSHELLEAVTNPYGDGWFAPGPLSWTARYVLAHGPPSLFGVSGRPAYPGEIADLCEPGSPVAKGRILVGRLDAADALPVTAFYSPGRGCITP